MTLSLSPAAVCQCFTLVSLCTSVADPNWIQIKNGSDPNSGQLIYGVAFTLHTAENLTNTDPLGGVNGWGMWLLYTLAAVCYSAILLSNSSFLCDFLGVGRTRPRLIATLHVCTAVLCVAALAVCGTCLYVVFRNLKKGLTGRYWDGGSGGGGGTSYLHPSPGESFYIAALALFFSVLAASFSLSGCVEPSPHGDYMPIDPGDSDSELPAVREPGEEWGEVFPDLNC